MERFLSALDLERGRLLLIAPPPMALGAWVPDPALVEASRDLAPRYRRLAAGLGVRFADAGAWGVALAYDGVHFAPQGHRAFAAGPVRSPGPVTPDTKEAPPEQNAPGARFCRESPGLRRRGGRSPPAAPPGRRRSSGRS